MIIIFVHLHKRLSLTRIRVLIKWGIGVSLVLVSGTGERGSYDKVSKCL